MTLINIGFGQQVSPERAKQVLWDDRYTHPKGLRAMMSVWQQHIADGIHRLSLLLKPGPLRAETYSPSTHRSSDLVPTN